MVNERENVAIVKLYKAMKSTFKRAVRWRPARLVRIWYSVAIKCSYKM